MDLKYAKILKSSFLVISIITFSIFIISFTAFYSNENFSSVCGCKLPIWVIVISISSFGIFAGSSIYYLISINIIKEKKHLTKGIEKIFNFLDEDEKKVINSIFKNSGKIYQSKLCKEIEMNKVRCSRVVSELENKRIIEKKKEGMTNIIKMDEELLELLKEAGFKN